MLLIRTCCFMQIYLTSWRKNWEKVKTKFCTNTWFSNLGKSVIPLESLHNVLTHLPAYLFSIQLNEAQNSILFCLHEQNMSTQTVMIKPCTDATSWCYISRKDFFVIFTLFQVQYLNESFSRRFQFSVFCMCMVLVLISGWRYREDFEWNTNIEMSRTGLHSIILLTFFPHNKTQLAKSIPQVSNIR